MRKGIGPQNLGAAGSNTKSPLHRSDKVSRQNYKPSKEDQQSYKDYKQAGGKGDIYQAYRVGFRSPDQSKEALSSTGTAQFGGVASRQS